MGFKFSLDNGKFLENIVFLELKRRGQEIYYHQKKQECDFLVKEGLKIVEAIQVCYDLNNKNKEIEINGLLEAMNEYQLKSGLIITLNQDEYLKIDKQKIKIISAWRWFIE